MLNKLTTRLNATLGQFLKLSSEEWVNKLKRLDSQSNHKILNLFQDVYVDLDLVSKLSKRENFLNRVRQEKTGTETEEQENAVKSEEEAPESQKIVEETEEPNLESEGKNKEADPIEDIDLGEWDSVKQMQFFDRKGLTNVLRRAAKFINLTISILCSEKVDLLTRLELITIPIKLKISNLFKDLSVDKKSYPCEAPLLLNKILNFLEIRKSEARRLKSRCTSEKQMDLAKSFLVFFSRFRGEFIFNFQEAYKKIQVIFNKSSDKLWVLNNLFVLRQLNAAETKVMADLEITRVDWVISNGLDYVFKNATLNWKFKMKTGTLSDLVKVTVAPMLRKEQSGVFKNRLFSVFNIVKRFLCRGKGIFEIKFLLEPLKSKLKASFVSKGKKTRALDVKILTIFNSFLCSLAKELVKRKEKSQSPKETDQIQNSNEAKRCNLEFTKALNYISDFVFECLSFLSISFVDNKYLWPSLLANLEEVRPDSRKQLLTRFNSHLSSANVNTSCALQSLLYLTDDLFREGRFEMILTVFKNLKEVLGSLDKKTKVHAYRALFYIMYRLSILKSIAEGKKYSELEESLNISGSDPSIFSDYTEHSPKDSGDFDQVPACEDWTGNWLRTAKLYLSSARIVYESKILSKSHFKNSMFELLESYPDLVSGFAGTEGDLKNCIDFLFPPFLNKIEDYCLEEDNVKALLGAASGGYSDGASSKIFFNKEKNYIMLLASRLYPKIFKSWMKKFMKDSLEIKKKHRTKKPGKLEGYESHILPLYFRRKDAIAVKEDSYFSVKKAFNEDLGKLKALGGQLYGVTMIGLPSHDHVETVLSMCLSYMSLCHPSLQITKTNLAANLRRNPLYRQGFEALVKDVSQLAVDKIVTPYKEAKAKEWKEIKEETRRKRKAKKNENQIVEETNEATEAQPNENQIEEETKEDKEGTENKRNQLVRCFSTILAAFSSNMMLLPKLKNKKPVIAKLRSQLQLSTNLLKIIITQKSDKEREFLTDSLLLLSQTAERNFQTKDLASFKYSKFLSQTESPLVTILLNHSENEYFTKRVFLSQKKSGLNSTKWVAFLSLFLESYFQHFDPSKGNIFSLFQVLSSFRDLDRKLLWHVANVSAHRVGLLLRNPNTDMVEYANFFNHFFKFYGAQMGPLDLQRRFMQIQQRAWYMEADIPYSGKLGQMAEIKMNGEKLVLLDEHFKNNAVEPKYYKRAKAKANPTQKTSEKKTRLSKLFKQPFPILPLLERSLSELPTNKISQSAKFLEFLKVYLSEDSGSIKMLETVTGLVPDPCSSDIATIKHLLSIAQIKKNFHKPQTQYYHDTDSYIQALFAEARSKSRFQGSSVLKNPPFRIKKLDVKQHERFVSQNLEQNPNLPWQVFEKIIRKSWDLLSSMQFLASKSNDFGRFFKSARLKIKAPRRNSSGQAVQNYSSQTIFLYYNFWLKFVKSFGPSFKKNLFKLMADKLLGPLSESVNVSYVATISLLMSLRSRGLLRSSFEHLIIGGLLRLAMTFNIKFVRLFSILTQSFYYDKTTNFHSINNVFTFFERFVFGVKHKSQVKWEEWEGIESQDIGNLKALYLYLRGKFVEKATDEATNENEDEQESGAQTGKIEEEGPAQSEGEPASSSVVKNKKTETLNEWKENVASIVLMLYGNIMFLSPHNLKRRGFKMLKGYKQTSRNFAMMLSYMTKYKRYLSALGNCSIPVETESNTKLLRLFATTRHRLTSKDENTNTKGNQIEEEGQSSRNSSESSESDMTSKEVALELANKDPNETNLNQAKPAQCNRSGNSLPSLKKDLNFRLFKQMVRSLEDTAASLQVLVNFLSSTYQFPLYKYEHLAVVLPKLRQIIETTSQVDESQRSGLVKQFKNLTDKVINKLNVSNFAGQIQEIGTLLASEFEKSQASSYKIFISRLMIALHLKEFSKRNCDLFVVNFGKFIVRNNFLAQNALFGTLVQILASVPLPVFEYLFSKVIQTTQKVAGHVEHIRQQFSGKIVEEGVIQETKGSNLRETNTEFTLFTCSFMFSAFLNALRKPRPVLLSQILQSFLMIIRSPLKDKTFLTKGRDSLKNFHEILKPTIDLDHYEYRTEDVKEILQLAGGLSYFA